MLFSVGLLPTEESYAIASRKSYEWACQPPYVNTHPVLRTRLAY